MGSSRGSCGIAALPEPLSVETIAELPRAASAAFAKRVAVDAEGTRCGITKAEWLAKSKESNEWAHPRPQFTTCPDCIAKLEAKQNPNRPKTLCPTTNDTASLELLAMLRHPKDVRELCEASDMPDIAVCRKLWAFRVLDWVRPAGETADLDLDVEGLSMIFGKLDGH